MAQGHKITDSPGLTGDLGYCAVSEPEEQRPLMKPSPFGANAHSCSEFAIARCRAGRPRERCCFVGSSTMRSPPSRCLSDSAWGLFVSLLLRPLVVPPFLGLAFAFVGLPESSAADTTESSAEPSVVEPRRYRGPYVPPAKDGAGPDPFAPGPDSPYWVRLEMTDTQGRKTFSPRVVAVATQLRYEHRNPDVGLDLHVDLEMKPQPFMTVNEKIYPVELSFRGWRLVADVTAEVGLREFESAWFAAFADQRAVVSGLPATSAVTGDSAEFRVEEASFGPSQTTVVLDDGRTTSRVGYAGWLTLRETFGSFVAREWSLVLQESFLLVYGAVIAGFVTLSFGWFRFRSRRKAGTAPGASGSVSRPRGGGTRKKRRRRR